jgi:hypothetical protein
LLSKRGVLNEPKNVAIYLVRRFLETGVASDHKPYGMVGLKIEELGHGCSGRKALPMPLLDSFLGRFEIEKGEPDPHRIPHPIQQFWLDHFALLPVNLQCFCQKVKDTLTTKGICL